MKLIGLDLGYMSLINRVMSLSLPNADMAVTGDSAAPSFDTCGEQTR